MPASMNTFDYKKILMAYLDHVAQCEGTYFLGSSTNNGIGRLTDDEVNELMRLSQEENKQICT